ncbi:S8 family serine peptidase [Marinoscillum sp.]|uniref:S8 family serine peptidase n=1 Tax=Marinoscillum sp. TaxID=2024838 RepID=UPI003BA89466
MKKLHMERTGMFILPVLLLILMALSHTSTAQQQAILDGVLRIKVTESLSARLEAANLDDSEEGVLLTGISSIDRVNETYNVRGLRRVFRNGGKFENKHKQYGLHRWYEVSMDRSVSVLDAVAAFGGVEGIEHSEAVLKKVIVGSNEPNYGPQPIIPEEYSHTAASLPGVPDDPFLSDQWHYNNTGQSGGTPGADISLFQAWGIETGSPDVIVAVTDGGIQVDHPDIADNMWVNTGEIPGNGIDDDGNGFVDDINGYGFGDDTGDIAPDAHGTHVGGTVAAVTNNGVGVAGVAGGSGAGDGARLMSCAAFGGVSTGGFAETYVYAADMGAVISQNSWGYTSPGFFEQSVLDAIDYFIAEAGKDSLGNQVGPMNGGIVIFAAGNDDQDAEWYPGFYSPTLAVSGLTHNDTKAWYTNFGSWVDISAPGGETISVSEEGVLSTLNNNQYGFFQGTSMACPHVSGLAALIISQYGGAGFSPTVLRDRLITTADDVDALNPGFEGELGPRINAFAALQSDDGEPPLPVTDLAALDVEITSVLLGWTAPLDSGSGSASTYDIRYSTSPIDSSNFESATSVANLPVPSNAGTLDTIEVSGLTSGTLYYFALKSSDFFGNKSEISNIVAQATNEAPDLYVSDSLLVADLLTAETEVQTVEIINNGAGPLDFVINSLGPESFASVSPSVGTVSAFDTMEVALTFDASGLFGGSYSQTLQIASNDPVDGVSFIELTLNVTDNGVPIAEVYPTDTLDFGGLFIGASTTESVVITNAGTGSLIVYPPTFSSADFSSNLADSVFVAPFDTVSIGVTYAPTAAGYVIEGMTIPTSDSANSSYLLNLVGEGLLAPAIEVAPDSLFESLFIDQISTQSLTISNTGDSDLVYTLETSGTTTAGTAGTLQVELPDGSEVSTSQQGEMRQIASGSVTQRAVAEIKWLSQSATTTTVLIVTPDSDLSDLEALLDGFPDVEADIFSSASLPSIAVGDLLPYDIVMTTNNTQWLSSGSVDPEVVGDVLADYLDAGGKVIVNEFAYSYDAWQMEGRFIDEGYGPFVPSTTDESTTVSLGSILATDHPVIQGVTQLDYTGFVQNVGIAPGATAIANWDNGELFVAANDDVVALNLLPDYGNGDGLTWTGDLALLYHNAIQYLGGSSFIEFSTTEGVVSAGASEVVDVIFNAGGLSSGTYYTDISVLSNVPGQEAIIVPASLEVTGPELEVSPDSLTEVLEKDQTSTQTITVTNNGSVVYPVAVSVSGGVSISGVEMNLASDLNARTISNSQTVRPKSTSRSTRSAAAKTSLDAFGTKAISGGAKKTKRSNGQSQRSVAQQAALYETDFEDFTIGDVNGQNGWFGQFGNWTVESVNPASGSLHFQGLSDGFGQSVAFSPNVGIGSDPVSSMTMKVSVTGSNVTWQLVPQSPTAGLIVTRLQFNPDGSASVLVPDSLGNGVFEPIAAPVPSGYFEVTIEAVRATSAFTVSFNGTEVFSGEGFAGDMEELVILSLMEVAGPTLDIDDLAINDGPASSLPQFVTVSPELDSLGAGQSLDITVTFDSEDLEFGMYSSLITIDVAGEEYNVPASLQVIGDPAIFVDPTVLQATVPYQGDTTKTFTITNTGGNPLDYGIQVVGADTDIANLPVSPEKQINWKTDQKTLEKLAADRAANPILTSKKSTPIVQLLAGTELFSEDFEGASFPPSGWGVVDNEGTGVVWSFAADYGEGNYAGTGEVATVSSDAAGTVEYDTELITPFISTDGFKNIAVQYNANYINLSSDVLDVDVQLAGDSTWTTVLSWSEDHGGFFAGPGEQVIIELDDYLGNASEFRLRWHYYNPDTGDWDWYAQVDDIVVLGDPKAWLAISPSSGSVPVGESAELTAQFDAEDIEEGFYVAGAIISSNAANTPTVGLLASLTVLGAPEMTVSVDSLSEYLFIGETSNQSFTVSNSGESPLKFSFGSELPQVASQKARIEPKEERMLPAATTVSLDGKRAIPSGREAPLIGTTVYGTGFEEFNPGDIDGQNEWAGQWGNWTVESINSFEGSQHFRGLSDGLGQSLAFSPGVGIGAEPISSTTMMMSLDGTGVTWQVIPQSTTAELVITRFVINTDNSLEVLVSDSLGNGSFEPVNAPLPSGYFELRIDVERATSVFTIYFDGVPVHTAQGFAGDIEELAVLSLMEVSDPTLDIDNLSIWDGAPALPWFSLSPLSGIVTSGGSTDVTVFFDATDTEKGIYTDVLSLISNDPEASQVDIPITLEVDQNFAPELALVSDTSVIELGSIDLTFQATDADDSILSVSLVNAPSFISVSSSAMGTATYSVAPELGDAGEYYLTVLAEDGRGATDSADFVLTVEPYGVSSFTLINSKTGAVVTSFIDSVAIDVQDPDFLHYIIQANTNPSEVGSVKFKVNGHQMNTDSRAPYKLFPLLWLGVGSGSHEVTAIPYTGKWAQGDRGQAKTAVFTLVNSTNVTAVNVVNHVGEVLMTLSDSSVIDISDPAFSHINLVAELDGPTTQVTYRLNGSIRNIDYSAPYSMAGDWFGYFQKWWVSPGVYTVEVVPVSGWWPQVAGGSQTITFEVVDGSSTARTAKSGEDKLATEAPELVVYPVPTEDIIELSMRGMELDRVELILTNLQGQIIHQEVCTGDKLNGKKLSAKSLGLKAGIYYLKVSDSNVQITREVIVK